MEFLRRLPFPRRLAVRVWLVTLPSALLSFERRQRVPRMPIGRARFLGLALIGAGAAALILTPRNASPAAERSRGLARVSVRPAVGGGLLALAGAGVLMRSFVLIAYALGLGFAFARQLVDLEDPQLLGREGGEWEFDETQV